MTSRERFKAAVQCQSLERPPVWLMRQAGRYLPEYRALKEKHSFVEMVRTPELATQVTLQPLARFPLDAAIIFSDILVIPEALGQPYHFKDQGGIAMDYALDSEAKINALNSSGVIHRLDYVAQALKLTRKEMGEDKALLGFCGSPWTLATYMVEGESPSPKPKIVQMFKEQPELFEKLMKTVTAALIDYVSMQVAAGVDAIQIFDTWGSLCDDADYEKASLLWIGRIIRAIDNAVPIILYTKGMSHHRGALIGTGAQVLSMDWSVNLALERDLLPPGIAIQGNLNPDILTSSVDDTRKHTLRLLEQMKGRKGHIFNLGHGLTPQAGVDNVSALVETVCSYGKS